MNDVPEGHCYRAWKIDTTRVKTGIVRAFTVECPGLIDPTTITGREYKERLQADGDWVEPAPPPEHPFEVSEIDLKNVRKGSYNPALSNHHEP
jgi:hypothetical protein